MPIIASTALPPSAMMVRPVSAARIWGAAAATREKVGVSIKKEPALLRQGLSGLRAS